MVAHWLVEGEFCGTIPAGEYFYTIVLYWLGSRPLVSWDTLYSDDAYFDQLSVAAHTPKSGGKLLPLIVCIGTL